MCGAPNSLVWRCPCLMSTPNGQPTWPISLLPTTIPYATASTTPVPAMPPISCKGFAIRWNRKYATSRTACAAPRNTNSV